MDLRLIQPGMMQMQGINFSNGGYPMPMPN